MKGVIGVALLLFGFTIAYLVLTGHLGPGAPAKAGSSPPGASQPATGKGGTHISSGPDPGTTVLSSPGGDVLGLPTLKHLHDVNGSLGGMS